MDPEEIIRPFRKEFDLPDTVVHLLYLLLQQEIENNYRSLRYTPNEELADHRNPAMRFAKGLLHIFSKLPKIYDASDSSFTATIHALSHFNDDDTKVLYDLCTPVELYTYWREQSRYKMEINDLQDIIDQKESGDDVSWQRIKLRHAKDALRALKEPEGNPYLTPFWSRLLFFPVSFQLPKQVRFEHTHCLATPGSGKTTLLQSLIHQDIETNAAIIVMAPKGGMIDTLSRLKCIDPARLIIVQPEKDFPVAINPFALKGDDQLVDLLKEIFDSIDADATPKQSTLLEYCIRLMLCIPGATIITLRDLLKENSVPPNLLQYVALLNEDARDFFEHDFAAPGKEGYRESKGQLMWRVRKLISKDAAYRIFSQSENRIDLNEIMAAGKVLLIDTDWKSIGTEASAFLGKLFLAYIALATQQRDTKKPLRAVYVYVDEAWHYLTDYLNRFLDTARESRVGLTLAHQGLDQLSRISTQLESSVHRTSVKLIGTCDHKDSNKMAHEIHTDPLAIQTLPAFHFHLYARGFLGHPITIKVNPYVERLPARTDEEMEVLIANNRERVSPSRFTETVKKTPQSPHTPETNTKHDW